MEKGKWGAGEAFQSEQLLPVLRGLNANRGLSHLASPVLSFYRKGI